MSGKSTNVAPIDFDELIKRGPGKAHLDRREAERAAKKRVDWRKDRPKTDRTEPLSFKVSMETVNLIQGLARAEQVKMVDILERALEMYANHLRGNR
jgi:hypothetical protein